MNRQVREAVEIGSDKSHLLLHDKMEYNRCILPSLQAVGPPPIKTQQEQDATKRPQLTQKQEGEFLSAAKIEYRKRVRDSKEERIKASKRLRMSWVYDRDTGTGPENDDNDDPSQGVKFGTNITFIAEYLTPFQAITVTVNPNPEPGKPVKMGESYKTISILDYYFQGQGEQRYLLVLK